VTAVDGESRTRTDPADVATVSASRSTLWMVPRMCSVVVVGEVLPPDAWSETAAQSNAEGIVTCMRDQIARTRIGFACRRAARGPQKIRVL